MAYDLNKIKQKYQELNSKKNTGDNAYASALKIEEGSNFIRILPNINENEPPYQEIIQHVVKTKNDKDPSKTDIRYIQCFKGMHNESCPLCDGYYKVWDLIKSGRDEFTFLGKGSDSLKAKKRYFFNVIDRRDGKVKLFNCPERLYSIIVGCMIGDEDKGIEALGEIDNPETGYDFNVVGTKQGDFMTHDQSRPKMKSTPAAATKKEIDELLGQRVDLSSLIRKEDYTEAKLVVESLLAGSFSSASSSEAKQPATQMSDDEFANKLNEKVS